MRRRSRYKHTEPDSLMFIKLVEPKVLEYLRAHGGVSEVGLIVQGVWLEYRALLCVHEWKDLFRRLEVHKYISIRGKYQQNARDRRKVELLVG